MTALQILHRSTLARCLQSKLVTSASEEGSIPFTKATHDNNFSVGVLAIESTDYLAALGIALGSNGARVNDAHVSLLGVIAVGVADSL